MDFRISYAQNREDYLIAAFFPDVTVGHYVDVGASDPTQLSVTKLFYERGWSGINVEPIPELADRLRAERPRDVTVQAGLGATAGTRPFRQYSGSGLSTTNPEMMDMYTASSTPDTSEFRDYTITITTLAEVLSEHPLPHLHFAKIDVEGSEFDVLRGNDWDAFRPELICIETDHMVRDWVPLLAKARYEQVFHDGLNAYFLASEAGHRAGHFRYSQAVVIGPPIVPPEVGERLSHVTDLWEQTQYLTQQRDELSQRLEGLVRQVKDLAVQVERLTDDVEVRDAALVAERAISALYTAREAEVTARLNDVEARFAEIISSQSWRYTYPIRRFFEILRARLPRRVLALVWRRVRPAIQAARTQAHGTEELSPDASAIHERLRALADLEGRPA